MGTPMSKHQTPSTGSSRVPTPERAAVVAYDELTAAGLESVETGTPHRTRATWIVPATADDDQWRVHIDPQSGATRVVQARTESSD